MLQEVEGATDLLTALSWLVSWTKKKKPTLLTWSLTFFLLKLMVTTTTQLLREWTRTVWKTTTTMGTSVW